MPPAVLATKMGIEARIDHRTACSVMVAMGHLTVNQDGMMLPAIRVMAMSTRR